MTIILNKINIVFLLGPNILDCIARTGVARNFDWGEGEKWKNFVTLFW